MITRQSVEELIRERSPVSVEDVKWFDDHDQAIVFMDASEAVGRQTPLLCQSIAFGDLEQASDERIDFLVAAFASAVERELTACRSRDCQTCRGCKRL